MEQPRWCRTGLNPERLGSAWRRLSCPLVDYRQHVLPTHHHKLARGGCCTIHLRRCRRSRRLCPFVVVAAAAARASLLTDHRASSLAVNERARKCSRGHLPRRSGHTHAHPTHARTAMAKGGSRKRKEGGSIWTPRAPYKWHKSTKASNQCNNL